jgi:Tol biopolymer transport system component
MGREPGQLWKIFTVAADGGNTRQLVPEARNEADPSWSPDGRSIVFGRLPEYMGETASHKELQVVDLQSGATTVLPNSTGLFSPRWSPDGHYIAAITLDQRRLMLYDLAARHWTELATGSIADPVWSSDSRSIYFHSFMDDGLPILRIRLDSRKLERIFEFRDVQLADAVDYQFPGLAPDDSPLVSVTLWTADIFAIDWKSR